MLKEYQFEEIELAPDIEECLENAKLELSKKQMLLKAKKLPVVVLFEGWGASGIGTTLGKVIQNMDPRFYTVETMNKITEEEARKPFLYRHFLKIPENGMATFYDHGWMNDVIKDYIHHNISKQEYQSRLQSIQNFERTLVDNGYLVIKFFFHISKEDQSKRMKRLLKHKNTKWRVSDDDLWQNKHYEEYLDLYNEYMNQTNPAYAPWYVIDATNKKLVQLQVLETLMSCIQNRLDHEKEDAKIIDNIYPLRKTIKLNDYDLSVSIKEETYRKELKKCRKKLRKLHNIIYRKKIPVIIAYEGWDAAGKGGNIKRVTSGLDPRGYTVYPIAAPDKSELNRHYLWRFYKRLPKDGHVAIFDRTWYGRVMVERLEGFCSENDWQRAYNEMNEFEKELANWGAIVIKFWVQIDNQTQLERFTERQNT
ncbi:phosphate--AMP phosphotransferase, partial [Thomasclavelia sp.]|uniref:phosphate--AMP phosphotransferase n=1 Tax=Thomasclavelia sp. TaxID=3025757 RepID=UPI0025ED2295